MKRTQPENIGSLLSRFLNDNETFSRGIAEARAEAAWGTVVGSEINALTTKLYVREGVLYVYVTSSVVRSELRYRKRSLIVALNRAVGRSLLHNIVLR